jgi:diamine N-acetyltransferase
MVDSLEYTSSVVTYRTPAVLDAAALAELGSTTFVETFGTLYSAENLNSYLQSAYSEAALAQELANPRRLFLVAEEAGRLVGFCKLGTDSSLPWEPPAGERALELKQLYLRKSHLGQGIGDALMEWALSEARVQAVQHMVLSVYCDNLRAQTFYQRYGFEKVGDFIFMVGTHRDDEFLYRLVLPQK